MNLNNAPFEQLLRIVAITNESFENEMKRSGLRVGSECHKHLSTNIPSLRLKGPKGSVVLGGGLTRKIILNVSKEQKELAEIKFNDCAEVAEIKGGCWLQKSLEMLGIKVGSKVRLMRRLPPMEYVIRINNQERIKIGEAFAARIIGCHEEGNIQQFSSARVEIDFKVTDIAGGRKFMTFMKSMGISLGEKIVLEGLEHVSELFSDTGDNYEGKRICLKTVKGAARIHLSNEKAEYVEVTTV